MQCTIKYKSMLNNINSHALPKLNTNKQQYISSHAVIHSFILSNRIRIITPIIPLMIIRQLQLIQQTNHIIVIGYIICILCSSVHWSLSLIHSIISIFISIQIRYQFHMNFINF